MARSKTITVEFFQCDFTESGVTKPLGELFQSIAEQIEWEESPILKVIGGSTFELKELERDGSSFKGRFAKYRFGILPNAGVPGGNEREIDLEEDEQLVESTFFRYYPAENVMALWINRMVGGSTKLCEFFTDSNQMLMFNEILNEQSYLKLMADEVFIRNVDIRIATPKPEFFQEDDDSDISSLLYRAMLGSSATSLGLRLTLDPQENERTQHNNFKRAMRSLSGKFDLKKANLTLENEQGFKEPIDLVTDKIKFVDQLKYEGSMPTRIAIYDFIESAYATKREEIVRVIGQ